MPFNIDKYTNNQVKTNFKLPVIWKFIIAYILLQFSFNLFLHGIILALLDVVIVWAPILFLPCLLKYCFRKHFTKKQAIAYVVIFGILLLFGNVAIDIIIKSANPEASTTTVWNLLMAILPYYLLTDEPLFSHKSKKKETD